MNQLVGDLNNDQLDGLAKLCFDLAKAAFILAIIPSSTVPENYVIGIIKIVLGLIWGLVCTYLALILLKYKKRD